MKKKLLKELIRFSVTVLTALAGSSALDGCTAIPIFNF